MFANSGQRNPKTFISVAGKYTTWHVERRDSRILVNSCAVVCVWRMATYRKAFKTFGYEFPCNAFEGVFPICTIAAEYIYH